MSNLLHIAYGTQTGTAEELAFDIEKQSKEKGADEVFNAALIGGLAGAAAGIGIVALLELLKESKE